MIQGILIEAGRQFVIRQYLKWRQNLDWDLVRKDALERIALLLPGEQFDAKGQFLVGVLIDILKPLILSLPADTDYATASIATSNVGAKLFDGVLDAAVGTR